MNTFIIRKFMSFSFLFFQKKYLQVYTNDFKHNVKCENSFNNKKNKCGQYE